MEHNQSAEIVGSDLPSDPQIKLQQRAKIKWTDYETTVKKKKNDNDMG